VKTLEFSKNAGAVMPSIACRTKDGLALNLEVSFQYRVIPDKLYSIYNTFGLEMETVLLRMAIDTISDVAT
jgi:hypothetical protein